MNKMRIKNLAFTLIELLAVLAVLAILAASILPALARTRSSAQRIACADNLKQVGVAFRTWAAGHDGTMPMKYPMASGGADNHVGYRTLTASQLTSRGVFGIFLVMSNQLATPKVLFCPAEYETSSRQAATTFANAGTQGSVGKIPCTNDLNVSYFVGVDAQETMPRMLLTGDHNLGNGNPPMTAYLSAPATGSPFLALGTNYPSAGGVGYMDNMHARRGNVGMADGSVEYFSRSNLQDALRFTGDPGRATGPGSMPTGANRIQLP
jgi:prepilin-type N-terminal cleavage/methylation domain-containing protein/prepilin-type processing-associated H-X9-DG protein